mgnify:CR=1 FL=1
MKNENCRAPQGARGLKYQPDSKARQQYLSRPARGAWVEMFLGCSYCQTLQGRAPQGARGLKFVKIVFALARPGRAPQGARGLKFLCPAHRSPDTSPSRPARGAWVEIRDDTRGFALRCRRAPQGARGLKRSRILIAVSLHKKEVSANRQRLPFIFLFY